ncbi:urea transporter [Staphylococcus borealis]|nr:urea transporter [Staphylococcus borealis]MDM7862435.1 urea transporter [Staphylococcus borealis]MDM7881246.1 urea transporter [Staphylococcus borealis]
MNNKWSGVLILIGLFVARWEIGIAAMIGSVLALLLAPFSIIVKRKFKMA